MKTIKLSLASLFLASSALAQTLPEADQLSARVVEEMPSYWSVDEFRLVAESDVGDAARPRRLVRFEVDSMPRSPLFALVDQQEPFAIVAQTHGEGVARTLYGVMDLSFRAGEWSGDIDIENPVGGLGQPADLFDRPILVMGDPETDERIEQLRSQRETNAAAQFERQMTMLGNEQEAALLQLQQQHDAELESARRNHVAELSRLRSVQNAERTETQSAHESAMRQLVQEHEREIAALRSEHESLEGGLETEVEALRHAQAEELAAAAAEHETAMIALESTQRQETQRLESELRAELLQLTEGLEPQVQAARQEHARTISELRLAHEEELEEMRVAHAQMRGDLRERLSEEVAAAEAELNAEIQRLQSQLGRSEEAQALQAAFLASVKARSAAALDLQRELETAMARRVRVVQQLPQQYRGGVRCRSADGQIERSWQIALGFGEVNPSGMRGNFSVDRVSLTSSGNRFAGVANLVIRSPELVLPLQARLSLAGASDYTHIPFTIDVTISESTVMTGSETTTWTIDNAPVEITCTYEFA